MRWIEGHPAPPSPLFLSPDEDLRRFARAYDSSYVEDDMHGENGQEMSRRDRLRSPTGLGTVSVSFENNENNEHNMYDTKQRRPTRREDSVTNEEEGRRRNRRREEGSNAVSVFASSGPSTISGSFVSVVSNSTRPQKMRGLQILVIEVDLLLMDHTT